MLGWAVTAMELGKSMGLKDVSLVSTRGATGREASGAVGAMMLVGQWAGLVAAAGSAHPGQLVLAPGQRDGTGRGQAWTRPHLQQRHARPGSSPKWSCWAMGRDAGLGEGGLWVHH